MTPTMKVIWNIFNEIKIQFRLYLSSTEKWKMRKKNKKILAKTDSFFNEKLSRKNKTHEIWYNSGARRFKKGNYTQSKDPYVLLRFSSTAFWILQKPLGLSTTPLSRNISLHLNCKFKLFPVPTSRYIDMYCDRESITILMQWKTII